MIKYKNETVSLKDEHQQMATELYKLQQSYKQNQQQKKFIPLKPSTHWNITNNQLSQNFITNSAQVSSLQSLPPTIPKSQLLMKHIWNRHNFGSYEWWRWFWFVRVWGITKCLSYPRLSVGKKFWNFQRQEGNFQSQRRNFLRGGQSGGEFKVATK